MAAADPKHPFHDYSVWMDAAGVGWHWRSFASRGGYDRRRMRPDVVERRQDEHAMAYVAVVRKPGMFARRLSCGGLTDATTTAASVRLARLASALGRNGDA